MSFRVDINDQISLAELVKINKNGGIVLKTPHVGNIYPNNLAIALLGITMLFYDRTLGRKDINFHPHKIIKNGRAEIIADPNVLITHAKINLLGQKKEGTNNTSLINFHMTSFKKALPDTFCFTYTEYLQNNKDKITQVLEVVTRYYPDLWTRIVDNDGKTHKINANNWGDIERLGVYGLDNIESGWIIPNMINIVFHGAIDAAVAGWDSFYLLSGPDMYKYIKQYTKNLDDVYKKLKNELDWKLPDVINCQIIPVADMRFVVEDRFRKNLDELMILYFQYNQIEKNIENIIKGNDKSNETKEMIKEKNKIKSEMLSCISSNIKVFEQTVFYDIKKENSFTQYDLLDKKKLYIHPWAINTSLEEVSRAYKFIFKCYLSVNK